MGTQEGLSTPQTDDKAAKKGKTPETGSTAFVTHFRHWRSGEIIYAKDHGLKAFPIGGGK